jgi:hypothetical protein
LTTFQRSSVAALGDEPVDGLGKLVHQRLVEEVQRWAVDAQDGQRAVVVEADEGHSPGSMPAGAYRRVEWSIVPPILASGPLRVGEHGCSNVSDLSTTTHG